MTKLLIPYITSEDISKQPDQAAHKLNQVIDAVNHIVAQLDNA